MNLVIELPSDGVLVIRALPRYEVNDMSSEMFFDLLIWGGIFGVFYILAVIVAGLLYIAYMFIPRFQVWCDSFVEGLPEWEEVE